MIHLCVRKTKNNCLVDDLKNIKEFLSQKNDINELLQSIFYSNLCQPTALTQSLISTSNELLNFILSGQISNSIIQSLSLIYRGVKIFYSQLVKKLNLEN